jgi:hypothetical protein
MLAAVAAAPLATAEEFLVALEEPTAGVLAAQRAEHHHPEVAVVAVVGAELFLAPRILL